MNECNNTNCDDKTLELSAIVESQEYMDGFMGMEKIIGSRYPLDRSAAKWYNTVIMAEPNPFKVIESCITQLDSEMKSHQKKCKKCPCPPWNEMVETWNFYHLSLIRTMKSTGMWLPPNYEGGIWQRNPHPKQTRTSGLSALRPRTRTLLENRSCVVGVTCVVYSAHIRLHVPQAWTPYLAEPRSIRCNGT